MAERGTSRQPWIPVRRAVAESAAELASAGVGSPRADAELLAAHLLGVSRGALVVAGDLDAGQAAEYRRLTAARASRVPLQHLTGEAPFRRLVLAVGPGVFIPRPETELLVEWGLGVLRSAGRRRAVVVDLCSGSGAVALAVADECPGATVHAVEADPAALRWLRRNVDAAGTPGAGRAAVTVVAGDATDPGVLSDLDGAVDLVLCNPPYVPEGTPVAPEVAGHDPAGAVFGGPDGLDVIRGVVRRAAALLRPGGALGIEHDDGGPVDGGPVDGEPVDAGHGAAVPRLLAACGYTGIAVHRDLTGRPRFTTATAGPRDPGDAPRAS